MIVGNCKLEPENRRANKKTFVYLWLSGFLIGYFKA
jgi:hypothetical protein